MMNTPKGESCPRCGWKHGSHVCVDLSQPHPGEGLLKKKGASRGPMSEEQKQKIRESQIRRWRQYRMETL